jgi:NitT/TauT family transport system permease protein
VVFWLALWQVAAMCIKQEILLVSPVLAVGRLAQLALTPGFWGSIGFSLLRIASGFLLGLGFGVGLAVCSALWVRVRELLAPFMQTAKSIPVASFIILCLVWISSRNLSVFIAFLMVLPVIYTNTLEGIGNMDKGLQDMARVFGVPAARRVAYIYTSQVMPYIKSGCKISLGICWKAGIAAEVIGIPSGSIGEKLYQSKIFLDMPDLFAWTIVIVTISVLFEKLVLRLMEWGVYAMEHR